MDDREPQPAATTGRSLAIEDWFSLILAISLVLIFLMAAYTAITDLK